MQATSVLSNLLFLFLLVFLNVSLMGQDTCVIEADTLIVWGADGEGSFGDGFGEWEVFSDNEESDVFIYNDTVLNKGVVSTELFSINSPTKCNGGLIADFDFFSTGGDPAVLEELAYPYPYYSGHLTSPTIDLSNTSFPVVNFYQFQLILNGQCSFQFSTDNGISWSEAQKVESNNYLIFNGLSIITTEFVQIAIPEAANQPEVKLRFLYQEVDFYFWQLDDIYITAGMTSELHETFKEAESVSVYPNPSDGAIHIKIEDGYRGAVNVALFDAAGKKVFSNNYQQYTGNPLSLDFDGQVPGLYLLKIEMKDKMISHKLVIH